MGLGVKCKIVGTENRVIDELGEANEDSSASQAGVFSRTFKAVSNKLKSSGAYTLYQIEVSTRTTSDRPWIVQKRFSEFLALHEQLKGSWPVTELPPAPKKTLRQRQFDAVAIAERKVALLDYLNALLNSSVGEQSGELRQFLGLNAEGTGPADDDDNQKTGGVGPSRPLSPGVLSVDEEEEAGDNNCDDGTYDNDGDAMQRPVMTPNALVDQCETCQIAFSLLERKHHCRRCGGIFCKRCASQKLALPTLGHASPVRVCDACHKTERMAREADFSVAGSVKDSKNMRQCVEAVFCGLTPDQSVYTSPRIPLDKFKNAVRSCKIPSDERPVVLLDNSKMRSGYSAVVFGVNSMYFSCTTLPESVGAGSFSYPQLFKQKMYTEDDDNLHVGPHKIINLTHVGISSSELLELLESLKRYVHSKEQAARLGGASAAGTMGAGQEQGTSSNSSSARIGSAPALSQDRLPGSEDEWLALLRDAFEGLGPQNSCFKHPDIPPEKLANFRKKGNLALGPAERELLFVDNTRQGSGYQGILFSASGVHFCADRLRAGSAGTGFLSWFELFDSRLEIQGKNVAHLASGKRLNLAGSAVVPAQLMECLHTLHQSLLHHAPAEPTAAAAAAPDQQPPAARPLEAVDLNDESTYLAANGASSPDSNAATIAAESAAVPSRKLLDVQPLEFDDSSEES